MSRAGSNDNSLAIGNRRLRDSSIELTSRDDPPGRNFERDHLAGHGSDHDNVADDGHTGLHYSADLASPQGSTGVGHEGLHLAAAVPADHSPRGHCRAVPGIAAERLSPGYLSGGCPHRVQNTALRGHEDQTVDSSRTDDRAEQPGTEQLTSVVRAQAHQVAVVDSLVDAVTIGGWRRGYAQTVPKAPQDITGLRGQRVKCAVGRGHQQAVFD